MPSTRPFPTRTFGVLLSPSSLPGPEPIGTLGPEAGAWVDWLASTGAGVWQILPLTVNGRDDSPYFSSSAFAGNPWLIDLRTLADAGLLPSLDIGSDPNSDSNPESPDGPAGDAVDFPALPRWKRPRLEAAADAFIRADDHAWRPDYDRFVAANAGWLDDHCLFFALKDAAGPDPWWTWDRSLRAREPEAVLAATEAHAAGIARWRAILFFFDHQWEQVRRRANEAGILVLGDIPIYVAPDSADVWLHQDQFQLDADGRMSAQSGVPPDYFSATGQLWGNPLYRWEVMADDGFSWWIRRLRRTLALTDLVRIDHFRGLSAYWSVPARDDTAAGGEWVPGPGQAFVDAVRAALPGMPLVAEDLGDLDDDVVDLRDDNDLIGMRVLQFGFDGEGPDQHSPNEHSPNEHHPSRIGERTIAYTGTHDNDTLAGWWRSLGRRRRAWVRADTALPPRVRERRAVWWLIGEVFRSPAVAAVVPVQDLLVLGPEARMNTPSTSRGNWTWRMTDGLLTPRLARELRCVAESSGRL